MSHTIEKNVISGYFLVFSGFFFFPEKTKAANGELTRGRKILNFLLYFVFLMRLVGNGKSVTEPKEQAVGNVWLRMNSEHSAVRSQFLKV